ncbi:hypothetical protein M427DRAFT_63894 [Gonapodya prolifera JEL478]|uniref:Rieske domain-containing protein n=1 Tax=Gonapodya prolifera (strain JEL478) TaxID=1344416 RepID=A0A138ZZF4_GONPJ|nr:hypothetical protein M427DRAFT_63894 [Gonapodya prolifera JEL478]|eukprot:KXS09513.1 hypothetical protein M427DRAFT_63894 [Gonapodya prolifera JEL478]
MDQKWTPIVPLERLLVSGSQRIVFKVIRGEKTVRCFVAARPDPKLDEKKRESDDDSVRLTIVRKFISEGESLPATFALEAACPHMGAPLDISDIEDLSGVPSVVCTMHDYKFDMRSGQCTIAGEKEGRIAAKIFPSKIADHSTEEGGKAPWVFVDIGDDILSGWNPVSEFYSCKWFKR